jgi:D-alanyl-D-alanine carboxypeptidase
MTAMADEREDRLAAQRNMTIDSNAIANWPTGPVVNGEAAILMEAETGAILYAKNIHQKEYPASTTKLMTCLLATEKCSMDEVVTMSKTAIYDTPYDSSHIAMDVGEAITMEQALHAILIRSANEVSFAVGEHISGTWQDFASLMNERAAQLGCLDTHFINPNGLPDENHYTTSYDMALIARAFFANELLCKISSTSILHIPPSPTQPDDIRESSSNQLLPGKKYAYEYLVGSKTGYTDTARNCLVSCAEKDGLKLICVVMRDESPLQFEDTVSLFDYGFSNYEMVNVSQNETKYQIDNAGFFYSNTSIFGDSRSILSLNQNDRIVLPKTIRFDDVTSSLSYDTPNENQVAVITYAYNGVYLGEASVDLAGSSGTYQFASAPQTSEGVSGEGGGSGNNISSGIDSDSSGGIGNSSGEIGGGSSSIGGMGGSSLGGIGDSGSYGIGSSDSSGGMSGIGGDSLGGIGGGFGGTGESVGNSGVVGVGNSAQEKAPAVIFINVMKIFIVVAVIAALIFVITLVRVIAKNYVISPKRIGRRYHAPSRRRHRNGPNYDDLRARHKMQIRAAKQKYKRNRRGRF